MKVQVKRKAPEQARQQEATANWLAAGAHPVGGLRKGAHVISAEQ